MSGVRYRLDEVAIGGAVGNGNGVRPGYGWGVGAFGMAFLSGFLGWLAIVMAGRIRLTSTDIVWQATLAVAIAAAAVALLLAVGAWRRGGGVGVARVAAVIAVASVVVTPIGVALARPSAPYVRISAFASADGRLRWTATPHLVEAQSLRPGAPGTVVVGGEAAVGLCDTRPAQATIATTNGAVRSQATSGLEPDLTGAAGPVGTFIIAEGSGGSPDRAPNATIDVTVGFEPSNGTAGDRVLQAADSTTGQVRWRVPVTTADLGVPPITPLWVDNQVVIAASLISGPNPFISGDSGQSTPTTASSPPPLMLGSGSTVVALAASTGRELWRANIGSEGEVVTAAAGPAGVAVATQTALTLRNLETGSVVATAPLATGVISEGSANVFGYPSNPLIVTGDTIALATADSDLTVYGPTLAERWQQHLSIHHDPSALQLQSAGDTIYAIDQLSDPTSGC